MWYLVFVLLFLSSFGGGSGDGSELSITLKNSDTGDLICPSDDGVVSTRLIVGKMFRIIVKSPVSFDSIKCDSGSNNNNNIFENSIKKHVDDTYYTDKNIYVGDTWTNKWTCIFYPTKSNNVESCVIPADIRNKAYEPTVYVNGAIERTKTNENKRDSFDSSTTYKFTDGESVLIICQRQNIRSSVQLSSNAYKDIIISKKTDDKDFLYLKLTEDNNGDYVDCRGEHAYGSDMQGYVTRVYLSYDGGKEPDFAYHRLLQKKCKETDCVDGTFIEGLRNEKIIGMFNRNRDTLRILYEYDDDEVLSLVCDVSNPSWKYDDSTVEKVGNRGHYKLKSNATRGLISCTTYKRTAEIILIKKPRILISSTTTETVNPSNANQTLNENNSGSDKGPVLGVPAIIGIAVSASLFLLILFFITIQLLKKKPKLQNLDSDINYENLPEHNKGKMAVPSQWQEAQYTAPLDRIGNNDYAVPFRPTVDEMYATPVPKKQRAEKDNKAYASNDNLGPAYAQAIPKHLRKGVAVLPTKSDSTYAELALKSAITKKPNLKNEHYETESPYAEIAPSENSYVSVNPYQEINESPYAEVAGSESPYADPDNLKPRDKRYANVFNDPRYVNADQKEYAEPAYCEINRLH